MERSPSQVVADLVHRLGGRSRLKLLSASEPEPWGNWLIAPADGYLESPVCGPWPWREVEWIEVEPVALGAVPSAAVFIRAGFSAEVVGSVIRVLCAK